MLTSKGPSDCALRGDQNKSKHGWVPPVGEETGRYTTRHEGRGLFGNGDRSEPGARTWRGPADTSRLDRDARPGAPLPLSVARGPWPASSRPHSFSQSCRLDHLPEFLFFWFHHLAFIFIALLQTPHLHDTAQAPRHRPPNNHHCGSPPVPQRSRFNSLV